ncbi:MAG: NUDIX hydrolase [Pseudoruegeria sp.]
MIRRFGEPPKSGKKYTVRPGAYAILPSRGSLLLTFQAAPEPEFQLPGGGIDSGESAIKALHREVLEETGWGISNPRKLGVFRRFTFMPDYDLWAEKICHIYYATPVIRRSLPLEPKHSAVFLPKAEAISHLSNAGDKCFLSRFHRT